MWNGFRSRFCADSYLQPVHIGMKSSARYFSGLRSGIVEMTLSAWFHVPRGCNFQKAVPLVKRFKPTQTTDVPGLMRMSPHGRRHEPTPDEVVRLAQSFHRIGGTSLKLTGGDPALWSGLGAAVRGIQESWHGLHLEISSRHPNLIHVAPDLRTQSKHPARAE
jgi:hypothetical protein